MFSTSLRNGASHGRGYLLLAMLWLAGTVPARADDWPTFNHDAARTAVSEESLSPVLKESWVFRSHYPPRPAWDEPATWDGYNKVFRLKNRQTFDKAFHVASVGDAVYFATSSDDKVYCLNAADGSLRWQFYTEGPVRLAPTVDHGRVYVGSDDGYLYCLDATTGTELWKQLLGPRDRRVPGNGRLASLWAVRAGVVVYDGVAYCCGGVFPSERVYVCALDAATGDVLWKTPLDDYPAQGYLLASSTRLYVTTGRNRPLVFDRQSGKRLFQVSGGVGGTYALISGDMFVYGPSKTGQMSAFKEGERDNIASFDGNHMIVTPSMSYLHTDTELTALDRGRYLELTTRSQELGEQKKDLAADLKKAKGGEALKLSAALKRVREDLKTCQQEMKDCFPWKIDCDCPLSLVLAGETLYAGGSEKVTAYDAATGRAIWSKPVTGNAYGLAVANGRLFVSTDLGTIHCFEADENSDKQLAKVPPPKINKPGRFVNPSAVPTPGFVGPFVEAVAGNQLRVSWRTAEAMSSIVEYGTDESSLQRVNDDQPTKDHAIEIARPAEVETYQLRVGGVNDQGEHFIPLCLVDGILNYTRSPDPELPTPYADDAYSARCRSLAQAVVGQLDSPVGFALVLGGEDGQLAYELARNSGLEVVVVEPDADRVAQLRERLDKTGLYAARISVHHGPLDSLPYGPYFANLVLSEQLLTQGYASNGMNEVARVLRPSGGFFVYGNGKEGLSEWLSTAGEEFTSSELPADTDTWTIVRRGQLPGAGEWTHQYASPDNASCSQDDLVRGPLSVMWWGRPGSRAMPDRGPRNPAPVSAAGRLFVQGNHTLFGIDAYNGTICWFQQIATMRRANIPRDGSNMVATNDYLYVAIGDHCVGFEGASGHRELFFSVDDADSEPQDWGYLACIDDQLIGTATKSGAAYLGDKGEWYEDFRDNQVARVTSHRLFVRDRHTGEQLWKYERGAIINSTITIADDVIYFVESRAADALASDSSRLFDQVQQDQFLVALDLATGEQVWEKPYDFSRCQYMTYMCAGPGTLVVAGTDKDKQFHIYAFDTEAAEELWQHHAPTKKTHHSGHLSHPAIVGLQLFINKHTYDLRTGDVLDVSEFNWHGCGVTSASLHTMFRRYEYHGMRDLQTGERTEMHGIRGGCWLSLIPTGGVLLAPETSAGCSCGHALQASIAYVPTRSEKPAADETQP